MIIEGCRIPNNAFGNHMYSNLEPCRTNAKGAFTVCTYQFTGVIACMRIRLKRIIEN
jgi:hypothetical protein